MTVARVRCDAGRAAPAILAPMRLLRSEEVPLTAAASGIVFVLGLINWDGSHMIRNEAIILGALGLLYLIECARFAVSGTRRAGPRPAVPPPGQPRDSTTGAGT
jgi:hypothetical protein